MAASIQAALVANFSFDFRAGQTLRFGLAPDEGGGVTPVRVSLYDRDRHLATVARSDTGTFVAASEPAAGGDVGDNGGRGSAQGKGGAAECLCRLWGTGLSLEMPEELIGNLVRIFSFDADYQSRLGPATSWR
jgi:hypothetical protein